MTLVQFTVFFVFVWIAPAKSLLGADHRAVFVDEAGRANSQRVADGKWTPYQRVAKILHYFDWDAFVEEKKAIEARLNADITSLQDLEDLRKRIHQASRQQENLLVEMKELKKKTPTLGFEKESKNLEILIEKIKNRKALVLKMEIQVAKETSKYLSRVSDKSAPVPSLSDEYPVSLRKELLKPRSSWVPPVQKYIEPQ
jgi:hypothetical protein